MGRLLVAFVLVAATAVAYAPLIDNAFINYDDDLYVTNSHQVRLGLTRESVAWAFSSFHGANWFPLTRLSWMLDSELFGIEPVAFHATSLALHAATALALFAALQAMTGALACSAFAALVFALHPLHVESVAWAAARKDVLSGLFFALALWAWALYAQAGDRTAARRRYAGVGVCLALGLLAKQVLVTLPFVLLLLDEWPLARLRGRVRRALLEKAPLLLLVAAASGVAVLAQRGWGTVQTLDVFPLGIRIENALVALCHYVAQAFWPSGLSVFYPHPGRSLSTATVLAAGAFLSGVTAAAWVLRRRWPPLAVGWLWFLGMLVPVIGLVQIGQAARADRYTYLPLIGLSLPVAWGLAALASRGRVARAAVAATAAVALLALGAATFRQVQVWRDSRTLFQHALEVTSDNHVAHMNLGLALMHAGRLDEASLHLTAAVRLAPSSPMAQGLLGELRASQARWREAADHFRAALRGKRDAARWNTGLGRALVELGAALAAQGERGEAIVHFERALILRPDLDSVRAQLARALAEEGRLSDALGQVAAGLERRPESGDLHALRGRLLERMGREAEAVAAYRSALEWGRRAASLLNNLAWLLATSSDPAVSSPGEAVELAEEAAAASRVPEILDTLSVAYAAAGRSEEAADVARQLLVRAEKRGDAAAAERLRRRVDELSRDD